jgi:photosystem II stability/assembly factor-like uncharacterized protein
MLTCAQMRVFPVCLVLAAGAVGSGCTFYTACPPGGTNGAGAGASNTGGSSNQTGGNGSGSGGSPVVLGPTPTGMWVNETSNLANMPSECGNLSYVTSKPDEDMLLAGIAQHGMWSSIDGGDSWQQLGTGAGSAPITNRTGFIAFDPKTPTTYWEVGIYNAGALFITSDDGVTFQQLGTIHHDDYVSIDFSDPQRKTMLVSEHEQKQALLWSTDQGATWTEIGMNEPAEATVCTYPYVLDSQTFLLGCGVVESGDGNSGVYKSTDAGGTWTSVSPNEGGASAPLFASDGSIYWVTQFGGGMVRSTDQGDTWTQVVPQGVISNFHPSELPDGRIAAMSGRAVLLSADQGATWQVVTTDLGFDPTGFFYSSFRKAFYAWHFSCDNFVPTDGLMRYDFDYQAPAGQ